MSAFFHDWIWPAGGVGGAWGDVLGNFWWVILAGIAVYVFRNKLRRPVNRRMDELHEKLDRNARLNAHIIREHPDINSAILDEEDL